MSKSSESLNEQQLKQVSAALTKAENMTSCRISPIIASRSANYYRANHVVGFVFSLIVFGLLWFGFHVRGLDSNVWATRHTLSISLGIILLALIASFVVGTVFAGIFNELKLLFISEEEMQEAVCRRSQEAFHTLHSTGQDVVLYVSLFERTVRVFGDEQVNSKLSAQDWDAIRDSLIASLKTKNLEQALEKGIEKASDLLAHYFPGKVTKISRDAIIFID